MCFSMHLFEFFFVNKYLTMNKFYFFYLVLIGTMFFNVELVGQLQDRLYAGLNNGGTNLEICYSVKNTSQNNLALTSGSENQITILYGSAPLNGYFTLPNSCLEILNYNVVSAHPDLDADSFDSFETEEKFLWFSFKSENDLNIPIDIEVELFCFNWTVENNACSELVYWTFCDEEVPDTYYNDFGIFPLGSDCTEGDPQSAITQFILPVVLSNFTAERVGQNNQISWSTESEINNDYFTLQRSRDGITYETIAQIASKGNLNKSTNYTYLDKELAYGQTYYYRLSQYDIDGTITKFPKVLSMKGLAALENEFNIFPLPVQDEFHFNFENKDGKSFQLMLVDMRGKLVFERTFASDIRLINISELKSGMYNALIVKEDETLKQKFLKI